MGERMDETAARAELGVAPEAPPADVRAAFETRARLLDEAGKRLALERVVEAYRVLEPSVAFARGAGRGHRRGRPIMAAAAVACLFAAGVVAGSAIAHGTAPARSREASPAAGDVSGRAVQAPPDPQRLVLTAADLGPGFQPLRSGPAALGTGSSGARGWDAVYRSTASSTLVESIAVVYPSPAEATFAAGRLEGTPDIGTVRAVTATGSVLVMVVVAPAGDDAAPLLERARQAAVSRASAGSR